MYSIDWPSLFPPRRRASSPGEPPPRLRPNPTVLALGLTSFFTDISSEMIASVLPVYLVLHLGMSPMAFGVIDGTYQGAAAIARLAGGVLSDRWRRPKEVAAAGYLLSAACRPLLLAAAGSWSAVTGVIALDRIGKGIRTAPRDALLSASVPRQALAGAFGVHRAMDAAGAMLGPLVAFLLLSALPEAYDVLFVTSFGLAVVGLAAIVLLVPAATRSARGEHEPPSAEAPQWIADPAFRSIALCATLLSMATVSDSFLFLTVQKKLQLRAASFPLFYVGTPLVTSMLAISCGRLADRIGRVPVLLAGYAALALLYVATLLPLGGTALAACTVTLLGAHYAATDGVLTAMAASTLPTSRTGSGLAALTTATNLARFVASIAFGFLWTRASGEIAAATFLTLLLLAMLASAWLLPGPGPQDGDPDAESLA
jgi:MFS family permease